MAEYSIKGNLIERFIALPLPKLFVYGSENSNLAYLPKLRAAGISVIEIPNSNHWPVWDNPAECYKVIANFVAGL